VTGDERGAILKVARDAETPDYLAVGVAGISQQLNGVMECERTASAITDWSVLLVPGLLQTAEYARAILGASEEPRSQVEARVTLRMGRLGAALDRARPATVDVFVGESALRHHIGGPEVMARQLRALTRQAGRDGVTIRVVPASGGWHPGLMGSFVLYEFPTAPAIVHLEHFRSGAFLFEQYDIAEYKLAADLVRGKAMSPADTARLIGEIADEMEST
jgi:Domain of unknown function (DUF5753)